MHINYNNINNIELLTYVIKYVYNQNLVIIPCSTPHAYILYSYYDNNNFVKYIL